MEKVEFVCEKCSRRYRLRRPAEEIKGEVLFCPECGGKLLRASARPPAAEASPEEIGGLEDFLLSGPVALFFWDLPQPSTPVEKTLEAAGFSLRRFRSVDELRKWLRILVPQVLLYGTEDRELVSACESHLGQDLSMEEYRRIFRIWVSSHYRTLDPREIFLSGMHLVCQPEHLDRFEEIYTRARTYWEGLYRPYYQSLKEVKPV